MKPQRSEEEIARSRAYARGYNAGRRGAWPDHRPPYPPHELSREMFKAARELRDAIDSELAKFDENDDIAIVLGPFIDAIDGVSVRVTRWLAGPPLG